MHPTGEKCGLDEQRNEGERLAEALALNEPLATADYLKEELRQFWEQPSQAAARRLLKDWCARAPAQIGRASCRERV